MNNRYRLIFSYWYLLLPVVMFNSCGLNTIDPDDSGFGYDYFPIDSGRYWIYEVEELNQRLDTVINSNYYIKEELGVLYDSFDENAIELRKYKKNLAQEEWVLDSIGSIRWDRNRIIRVENDVRYLSMVFPIQNGKEWDSNSLNSYAEDSYEFSNKDEPYDLSDSTFDSTVIIIQERSSSSNIINTNNQFEVYAKGVGLIHKYIEITETQPEESTIGITYSQTLIEYGVK